MHQHPVIALGAQSRQAIQTRQYRVTALGTTGYGHHPLIGHQRKVLGNVITRGQRAGQAEQAAGQPGTHRARSADLADDQLRIGPAQQLGQPL